MSSEEDLDHCVKAERNTYVVLKLCVDLEGPRTCYTNVLSSLMCGMAVGKPPLLYREPPRPPQAPPFAMHSSRTISLFAKRLWGWVLGFTNAGGVATGGTAA